LTADDTANDFPEQTAALNEPLTAHTERKAVQCELFFIAAFANTQIILKFN